MKLIQKIFGDESSRSIGKLKPTIEKINSLESGIAPLSDDKLKEKTTELKGRLKSGSSLDDILPDAFATVRETAKRALGERHFDVQLMGGIVMHQGGIAEMKTGEGKTLVATLPTYLNALSGKGVHVVTVNDYLSRRDAVWMGQIYSALGLTVGVVNSGGQSFLYDKGHKEVDPERDELGSFKVIYEFLRPCTRREAYEADITYGTNNEFGFDYLRDNIAYTKEGVSQREHSYAIIDEIDSILIDEARTPLIISAPSEKSEDLYTKFAQIASRLKRGEDYEVDEKLRATTLTDSGIEKAEKMLGIENIYTEHGIKYVHHLETAVRAGALFERDKQYVVRDDEVIIVDEFTGRLMPGRRWGEGLHQAIEAKEGVRIQKESRTFASITFQNYFRMYKKIAGMTGTAMTSSEEFYKVYGLEVVPIPTNKPIARADRNDLIFQTEKGKLKAIGTKVRELHEKGQPVLIGTVSIEDNEVLSEHLKKEKVPHEVLNAKNHEREGEIIARAGEPGKVTVATNMAGRGVDIKLGGNPTSEEARKRIKELGGLFVLGTERHEARRIDDQLRGRSGRQGDEGETQFFVSLEDSLMRIFASDKVKGMMERFNIPEDQPIENPLINRSLESAQKKIEGFNFDARKRVLEFDDVLNQQRQSVYERRSRALFASPKDILEEIGSIVGDREDIKKTLEEKKSVLGEEKFVEVVRRLILQTIDMFWVEHLEMMDYMRGSVSLRAYGQRDPLVEYKKEGLRLFREMQEGVDEHIRNLIPGIGAGAFEREEQKLREVHKSARLIGGEDKGSTQTPVKAAKKVGRNDPCPCGSGKKYKKCHGAQNT